jgi:hypothetical protein
MSHSERKSGLTPVSWSVKRLGSGYLICRHVALLLRDVLWFDPWRSHSSVPTRTMVRLPRTAAVKDGAFWGRPKGLSLTVASTAAGLCALGLSAAA